MKEVREVEEVRKHPGFQSDQLEAWRGEACLCVGAGGA